MMLDYLNKQNEKNQRLKLLFEKIEIIDINNKKICVRNSFCQYNLTSTCNKCAVNIGDDKKPVLFKGVTSLTIDNVVKRIYS